MFRDPEGSEELARKYLEVVETAEAACFSSRKPD
jgi:hypothetical protein